MISTSLVRRGIGATIANGSASGPFLNGPEHLFRNARRIEVGILSHINRSRWRINGKRHLGNLHGEILVASARVDRQDVNLFIRGYTQAQGFSDRTDRTLEYIRIGDYPAL